MSMPTNGSHMMILNTPMFIPTSERFDQRPGKSSLSGNAADCVGQEPAGHP